MAGATNRRSEDGAVLPQKTAANSTFVLARRAMMAARAAERFSGPKDVDYLPCLLIQNGGLLTATRLEPENK